MIAHRIFATSLLVAVNAAVIVSANSADYGYERPGQRPVLNNQDSQSSSPLDREAEIIGQFKTHYVEAGKPRIVLLWHRDLTDEVSSKEIVSETVSRNGMEITVIGSDGVRDIDVPQRTRRTVHERDGGYSGERLSTMPAARDIEFQSGFVSVFRDAGVKLVDRDTILRLAAVEKEKGGSRVSDLDLQSLEMNAILEHSDFYMEIGSERDIDAGLGGVFRIAVIRARTGEIVANVTYRNGQEEGVRIYADSSGFQRELIKRSSREEGKAAALETLESLAGLLNES